MVWNFVGSIGGCLILYVLPPMAYLKIRYMHYRHMHGFLRGWWLSAKNLSAFLMTLFGLALLAVENYVAIKDVYNQSWYILHSILASFNQIKAHLYFASKAYMLCHLICQWASRQLVLLFVCITSSF